MHRDPKTLRRERGPRALALACLALVLPLVGGCETTEVPIPDPVPTKPSHGPWRQIHVADQRLEHALRIGPHGVRIDRFGLLHVDVPLHNDSGEPLELRAQFVFLGSEGVVTNDETSQRYFTVPENGTCQIHASARTASASDYRIYLWNARR